ncbi:hypothetical protein LXA43DRAFT_1144139 [Ganoderma leucocontextum]|nr:hypothetical protein LXA43DRAFT_1144139 [Ganoderma leucocontextum]
MACCKLGPELGEGFTPEASFVTVHCVFRDAVANGCKHPSTCKGVLQRLLQQVVENDEVMEDIRSLHFDDAKTGYIDAIDVSHALCAKCYEMVGESGQQDEQRWEIFRKLPEMMGVEVDNRDASADSGDKDEKLGLLHGTEALWLLKDMQDGMHLRGMPRGVTHLSTVNYSFTTSVWAQALNESAMILRWSGRRYPFALCIRHLSLSGVTTVFVVAMLRVCPNVETLEITHRVQLDALAPLPPAVRTLVLCHPGIAVSRKTMDSWALFTALDAGLFPDSEGKKLPVRIVVRSGTPDPAAFMELRHSSKHFNAELVYERDDTRRWVC